MKHVAKKVLLIEDDQDQIQLYQTQFMLNGTMDLLSADNGRTGLTMAQNNQVDLILLDLLMDDMGGQEVLRRLKDDSATKDIPVIILTNLYKDEVKKECLALGAATYWLKTEVMPGLVLERTRKFLYPEEEAGDEADNQKAGFRLI
ncbi:MAG: response regulator [Candidatus Paceibacterota bacterium]